MTTLLTDPEEELSAPAAADEIDTIDAAGASSTFDAVPEEAAAAAKVAVAPAPAPARSGCPRCGSQEPWGPASWCPDCGFYPAFDKLEAGAEPSPNGQTEPEPQSPWEAIPSWVWVLGGGCLAILAASVAGRLAIPANSPWLVLWTLLQTVIGAVVALVAHVAAYLLAIQKSDRLSPIDLVMNPVEIWRPTLARLPQTRRRLWLAAWGATAVMCATAILGGYDLNALFEKDWVDPRPQKNLLHEIVKQARQERAAEEGSLEDAMKKFVGDEPPVVEVPKIETDCLIVGFVKPDRGEGFKSLLLATVPPGGKLSFVGTVAAEDLPPDVRRTLTDRMPSLVRSTPFVQAPYDAVWLRPVLMCRIEHEAWTPGNQLKTPKFQKTLRDVDPNAR